MRSRELLDRQRAARADRSRRRRRRRRTPRGSSPPARTILVAGHVDLRRSPIRLRAVARSSARRRGGRAGAMTSADVRPRLCASATPRPTRWASSTTRTTSSGSRWRAPICCGRSGWTLPRDGSDGRVAAGDRSALRVSRGRRGTTTSSRFGRRAGCCRRCGWSSTTRSCVWPTRSTVAATRPHRARGARSRRAAVPAAGARPGGVRMKALVTGAAGFIGSHLSAALLDRGARRRRPRLLHRLLPAARSRKRNLAATAGAAGLSRSSRRARRRPTSRALLDGVTHVFHLAAQAGVRKSWGRDFRIYTDEQRRRHAAAARGLRRPAARSGSSTPRARRSTATTSRIPMREDALPQPVSPYGVTKLAAEHLCHLYYVNHGVPTTSLRYFTVYGPRQRPDMAFHRFITRGADRRSRSRSTATASRRATSRSSTDAVAATIAAGDRGRAGRASITSAAARGVGQPGARDHRPAARAAARTSGASRRRRATCATPSPTRRGRAPTWVSRPQVSLEEGLAAEYRWLAGRLPRAAALHESMHCCSERLVVDARLAGASRPALSAVAAAWLERGRKSRRPARPSPTSSCSSAAPRRSTRSTGSTAREYFRRAGRHLSAEPVPRRRQARPRRHLPRRGLGRVVRPGAERVPRVPAFYPTHAAPTTRSTSSGWRTSSRCTSAERDQTETREAHQGADSVRRALSATAS